MKRILKRLCSAYGPTGSEKRVANQILEILGDNAEIDNMGNVIAKIPNEGKPRLVLNAHMDEVGFMVTEITKSGTLHFSTLGGFDPIVLLGKRVVSENGVLGAIISKPYHLLSDEERETVTKIDDMEIDIGALDFEDAQKYVSVGDTFCFYTDFSELGDGYIKAKAIDDRGGCAILCSLYNELKDRADELEYELYFAFTIREEIGKSGVHYITSKYNPDYAIVVEGTTANDLPEIPEHKTVARSGNGGAISYRDGGTIYNIDFINQIRAKLDEDNINYQIKGFTYAGTDGSCFHGSAEGARVAIFSLPSRYIHSQSSVVKYSDIEDTRKAILRVVTK